MWQAIGNQDTNTEKKRSEIGSSQTCKQEDATHKLPVVASSK